MIWNRRTFLGQAATLAGVSLLPIWGETVLAARSLKDFPFKLGIASGDPTPDSVVLWTRLAPRPLDPDGGMPSAAVETGWEIAEDSGFRKVVQKGIAVARPQAGHSVHVEVSGLRPDREYWYRFTAGGDVSAIGRTRTIPLSGTDVQSLRYAFAACQRYEDGFYAAYRHMVEDDPALILFMGDYIYEQKARNGTVRRHPEAEAHDLDTYRLRYATYKLDPQLQAAHAIAPWMVIWDDHEVKNNYRNDRFPGNNDPAAFLRRRADAYQAYYEHMPLRRTAIPVGPAMQLYRTLDWGRLAQFQFIDGRQYRDLTPCVAQSPNGNLVPDCAERRDPSRSMLGAAQEAWLLDTLAKSPARWNVLAQQYVMAEMKRRDPAAKEVLYSTDGWDGYPASRDRLLARWRDARVSNPMALGGDMHSFAASDLRLNPSSPVVAPAFVGGAISSPGKDYGELLELMNQNPDFRFGDSRVHGYGLVDVTAAESRVTYKALADVSDPKSAVSALARFVVSDGVPGFHTA